MIIPYQQIAAETLQNLLEEFVSRDGTDYGEHEISLDHKVDQVKQQLKRGDVVIVFDSASESISIVTKHDAQLLNII
jgi:uncharacterized protein